MIDYPTAIKRGALAATRLQRDLGIDDDAYAVDTGRVDVFQAASQLAVPLLFRPLESLLGAYLSAPIPGILVTTKRPLSVQRFTAAHEIGHHALGHKPSLDDEDVLRRSFLRSFDGDQQEVEANAFAATLLLPRRLLNWHCARQEWTDELLHDPQTIYQLSIRVGTSYEATCWILSRYKVLSWSAAAELAKIQPRKIKEHILSGITPANYYGDVWILREQDAGSRIEGGPTDLFVVQIEEHSSAGFLSKAVYRPEGFQDLGNSRLRRDLNPDQIGGSTLRRLVFQSTEKQEGEIRIVDSRPWTTEGSTSASVSYSLLGPETTGISRFEHQRQFPVVN